ncbi:hypothetical protein MKY29_12130 [Psychrobacillus sp. FSL K6-2365]|uniref:hypothetical protein n=1 Tax=Psychrobacillus sp. FSL K6-2365 TaxID=2921546 RepID=UPI0030F6931D
MELYRIERTDIMGFRISEVFFTDLDKARAEYATLLMQYRGREELVKRGDGEHLSKPIVRSESLREKIIKEHMIEVWYKCSYEYDEWDTTVEHLSMEKINVA